jgi:DNA-binding beta-propeller fold protein YncE
MVKTNTVTANISVGRWPCAVSVNLSTDIDYVANQGDDTVSVVDGK